MRPAAAAAVLLAACAGDLPPPPSIEIAAPQAPTPGVLRIAGTGAMLPVVRALATGFRRHSASPAIDVEENLGSSGAIAAAHDGAVDLGMVSRPLSAAERALGVTTVPVAADAVVVAAHLDVPVDGLSSGELRLLYLPGRHELPDGLPVTVLLRDGEEPANHSIEALVPGIAPGPRASEGRSVIGQDDAMIEAIATTPRAIGLSSLGLVLASGGRAKALAIDGKVPTAQAVVDGTWPLMRPLAFVARPDRLARAEAFLDYAASPEAAALMREAGYRPEAPPP